jgi:hypothetical protein
MASVYSTNEDYLEPQEEYGQWLSHRFCKKCTRHLSIPKDRPALVYKTITQDLLRLSMNMDNIKSQMAQLIYNLTDTYIEGHNNRQKLNEVEKIISGELPPQFKELKKSCEESRLNLWDGVLKDFKDSKLEHSSLNKSSITGDVKENLII